MSPRMPTTEGTRELKPQFIAILLNVSEFLNHIEISGPQHPPTRNGTSWNTCHQYCPSNEKTQHLEIQLVMPVPEGSNTIYINKLYPTLRNSFVKSFTKDQKFQMSVNQSEGPGTAAWHVHGRVTLKAEVHLRHARERVGDIFINSHLKLALPQDVNSAFATMLTKQLSVKPDAEPLSGEQTSSWTPEKLQEQPPSATAATSAIALRRGPSTVHAPTWAFNRHSGGPHMCAGSCSPPVAS
jgi:hypothetical protein